MPDDRPVSWDDAKTHLRLSTDDDQAYVESLIDAAVDYAQEHLNASLLTQEKIELFYDVTKSVIELPGGPVTTITSVKDGNDADVSYDLSRVGNSDRITLRSGFNKAPLTVTYDAGYGDAADVPPSIKLAILMHVGTLYLIRESVSDKSLISVPHTLDAFYRSKARSVSVA